MADSNGVPSDLNEFIEWLKNQIIQNDLQRTIESLLGDLLTPAGEKTLVSPTETHLTPSQLQELWEGRKMMSEAALPYLQMQTKVLETGNTDEHGNHSPDFWKEVPPYPKAILEIIRAEFFEILTDEGEEGDLYYVSALCQTDKGDTVISIERIETVSSMSFGGAYLHSDFWAWDDQAINR